MPPKSQTLEEIKIGWQHCITVPSGKKGKVNCNYCLKETCGGITRIKDHLV